MTTLPAPEAALTGRRVLLTGHTGFKGGWLLMWLARLGAQVTGYALPPSTRPSLFSALALDRLCRRSVEGDVCDLAGLRAVVREAAPEVVFHLAAQPLVRASYGDPLGTLATNVMGTAHLLEALRAERLPAAVVVVTTDKCYENREGDLAYREDDALGGHDPYSTSKAAAELVVAGYRRSYFAPDRLAEHGLALATARAGNVVGGGDWSADRLVPDAVAALAVGQPVPVRNPNSVRPWQHVIEPLAGYLRLAARLLEGEPAARARFCRPFNFGPRPEDACPVRDVVEGLVRHWGSGRWEDRSDPRAPHEGATLRLAIDRAVTQLGWRPRWSIDQALARTVAWYRAFHRGASGDDLRALSLDQIDACSAGADTGADAGVGARAGEAG